MDDSNIINDKLSLNNEEDNTIIKHPTIQNGLYGIIIPQIKIGN